MLGSPSWLLLTAFGTFVELLATFGDFLLLLTTLGQPLISLWATFGHVYATFGYIGHLLVTLALLSSGCFLTAFGHFFATLGQLLVTFDVPAATSAPMLTTDFTTHHAPTSLHLLQYRQPLQLPHPFKCRIRTSARFLSSASVPLPAP